MMLEGGNMSSAVSWVREDLDECLETVRDRLEEFAEDTDQREPLTEVQDILERLNLTFLTMQQEGAIILTDEMIAVGGHLLHNPDANAEESLNALTDAVIVLPAYLDRLQAGHEDLPILLLPTLNELRATYDDALLSEGTLFAPALDIIIQELSGSEADHIDNRQFPAFARKMRGQYQMALLKWLKEQSHDELLEPMQAVCRQLYKRLRRNELRRLWWITEMTLQGLRDHAIDNDLPLRRLFARLDMTLKSMVEGGEEGPAAETVNALSRALLFYAAQAHPGSRGTDILRERFRLEELIPDREALLRARGAVTGRDAELFHSIGIAVREELTSVKDNLDMELRTGRVDPEQREQSKTSLRQLADTLNMLNLPVPARAVEGLVPDLEATDNESNMDLDSPLMALARRLLEVESILETHIQLLGEPIGESGEEGVVTLSPHEQRQILNQMLDECVVNMQAVQDAIHKRLEGEAEADYSTPLQQISGALTIASQGEVSALVSKLDGALNAELNADSSSAAEALEALTDAVAALELFLAGCRDEQANSLRFLEIMHQRLDGLPEASESGESLPTTTVDLPMQVATDVPDTTAAEDQDPSVGSTTPAIDPNLLDIFLEEFESVRTQLQDRLQAWLADSGDNRALADIRRSFHTIKGSGRMVGAMEMGDFAWRLEQALNKLVEERIPLSSDLTETVTLGVACLDGLKARLLGEDTELEAEATAALAACARELANGREAALESAKSMLPESVLLALVAESSDQAHESTTDTSEEVVADSAEEAAPESVEEQAASEETPAVDPAMRQIIQTEIESCTESLAGFVAALQQNQPQAVDAELVRAMHTMAGSLAVIPLGQESDLARKLEQWLEAHSKDQRDVDPSNVTMLELCVHRFSQRAYVLESGNSTTYPLQDEALLAQLDYAEQVAAERDHIAAEPDETLAPVDDAPVEETLAAESETGTIPAPDETAEVEDESEIEIEPRLETEPETETSEQVEEGDPALFGEGSIIPIFLEEAVDVLERCDGLLNTWRDNLSDRTLIENLQREVHTFKGGARMAELTTLGDLSHAMESLMEDVAASRMEATVAAVQALEEGCDQLTIWVEQLQSGRMPEPSQALERFEKRVAALGAPSATVLEEVTQDDTLVSEELASEEVAVPDEADSALAEHDGQAIADEISLPPLSGQPPAEPISKPLSSSPQREFRDIQDRPAAGDDGGAAAQIRVAAELMDKLVNFSGEISIYRSRLEQQMGTVRYNLKEVDATVQRLREQLRKMDAESEAQMMSRYQNASGNASTEFDPLELDRFSNMQQLSRGLSESVSDLLNLHEMLDESIRQAEQLLTQQSRVSSELQEGLMQTRMTPFGSAAPRLRRVVRSAAAETGKKARLQLRMAGSNDQLDRNVLERITAPLEHMLRNAIAHGIESPKRRRKLKKDQEGSITVTVEAEATEFVIRVQDDGGGIDLEAVRRKAVERGLMKAEDEVSPQRLVQFIRDSGFSTSKTVTGLAGRGVGMDVVNAEIKQIGGSMEIETEKDVGTRFTIRIPFSLAVMQAIGVEVGERTFQIPLNSVAGVARISPTEYSTLIATEDPAYEFAGERFPIMELEGLLDARPMPLDSENVSLLMIRAGEHLAAFRVTGMQGHQEVVVKPVGPQISSIPGILGGTIAADGQVMLILDMGPLIRRGLDRPLSVPQQVVEDVEEDRREPLVLVVDDSITMRKVTSRVLENHAVEVMTAQDGLDAIEQLHDRVPDLMLLDIEMPRMDGYELLEHVRADARLRHVPVIMITSRAGQKHRKKARQAGANDYMTKPYQEPELVDKVSKTLNIQLVPRRRD